MTARIWDESCDVLVVGSGGGALTGAVLAARQGLDVLVVDTAEQLGGTTAFSGGGMWLPGNAVLQRAGVIEAGLDRYLDATVGTEQPELRRAFLAAAPAVVAALESEPELEFEWRAFPDYFCAAPGALAEGRSIYAKDFVVGGHEAVVEHLGGPLPPAKGGWREPPGTLIGGRALLGRLLVALDRLGVQPRRGLGLRSLLFDDGRVVGAVVSYAGGAERRIEAARGVLLACGGFERSDELRHRWQDPLGADWTLGAEANTGAGLLAAVEAGAATDLLGECWWAPGFALPDGSAAFRLFERGLPGGIIVNGAGARFADESLPYDRLGRAMVEGDAGGAFWFVADQGYVERYGFATLRPGREISEEWWSSGVIRRAATVAELAAAIDIPAGALCTTVEEWNGFAAAGVDGRFGRGEDPYDRFFGDPTRGANPNLGPIEAGPFYAWRMVPADLGTKGGVVCDGSARALRPDGSVIAGLYAAGNTMASWTRRCYPGPGTPIASGMAFAWQAVADMAAGERAGA